MSHATPGQRIAPKTRSIDIASASIRPRARRDGTVAFDVRYRLDGRSKSLSFETNAAAQRWATIVRRIGPAEALALIREADTAAAPTLDEWADRYIRSRPALEASTREDYRAFMRISISPTLGALPVDAITPTRIAEWVTELADRYAGKTIANRHGFLYAVMQTAVEEGLITRNPCGRVPLPRTEATERVFLSPAEYRQLLAYIPGRHRLLVELLAKTGLRWGEATALRWSDIDLRAGTLRVSRAWHHANDRGWYLGAPKTEMARRTVPLPATLLEQLRPVAGARGAWLFTTPAGDPIRHAKFMTNVWYPAVRLANGEPAFLRKDGSARTPTKGGPWDIPPAEEPLGKSPGVHSLRHSNASWRIARNVPMAVVQAILGHESIDTTIGTYTHFTPRSLVEAAAAVDAALDMTAT